MKKLLVSFTLGVLVGATCFTPEPEVVQVENLTCSAAKAAASKVCDCQIVCYEDRK